MFYNIISGIRKIALMRLTKEGAGYLQPVLLLTSWGDSASNGSPGLVPGTANPYGVNGNETRVIAFDLGDEWAQYSVYQLCVDTPTNPSAVVWSATATHANATSEPSPWRTQFAYGASATAATVGMSAPTVAVAVLRTSGRYIFVSLKNPTVGTSLNFRVIISAYAR